MIDAPDRGDVSLTCFASEIPQKSYSLLQAKELGLEFEDWDLMEAQQSGNGTYWPAIRVAPPAPLGAQYL